MTEPPPSDEKPAEYPDQLPVSEPSETHRSDAQSELWKSSQDEPGMLNQSDADRPDTVQLVTGEPPSNAREHLQDEVPQASASGHPPVIFPLTSVPPGESKTSPSEGRGKRDKFEPRQWHWWLSVVLGPLVTIISVVVAVTALLINHSDNERALAATKLPSVNGSPGQPVSDIADQCSDSPATSLGGDQIDPWSAATHSCRGRVQLNRFSPELGGDERNMFGGREVNSSQLWSNNLRVEANKTYVVRIYIHNNAADSAQTVATGTRVRISLPSCKGRRVAFNGFIYSPDAFPIQVWGGVNMTADSPFRVSYVVDSARLEGNFTLHGDGDRVVGTDFLAEPGQLVGQPLRDGNVRGGLANAMYFSILVRVSME